MNYYIAQKQQNIKNEQEMLKTEAINCLDK